MLRNDQSAGDIARLYEKNALGADNICISLPRGAVSNSECPPDCSHTHPGNQLTIKKEKKNLVCVYCRKFPVGVIDLFTEISHQLWWRWWKLSQLARTRPSDLVATKFGHPHIFYTTHNL